MLKYTGHPYIDIGVATIAAFANKKKPEDLTEDDLSAIARYMKENYSKNPMRSFLTVAFLNSGFTQPAYFSQPEKQNGYADKVLFAFRKNTRKTKERDIFFGFPTPAVSFDINGRLPPGRAFRQHIPLLTGEEVINFFPEGDAGLPVSGEALLAIHAFPLGCAKVSGKLLAVHSDNPYITYYFAKEFLEQNRKAIHIAQQSEAGKIAEPQYKLRTLIVRILLSATEKQKELKEEARPFSITAYHLSSSGQGPSLEMYHLPLQVISFIRKMWSAQYKKDWEKIEKKAWQLTQVKQGEKKSSQSNDSGPQINYLYEDLFDLPQNAASFLRTYLLPMALNWAKTDSKDPRKFYSTKKEADLVSWRITEQFLRGIMNMEPERITQIRDLGDKLAEYVNAENNKRFFREFFTQNRYEYFRTTLLKANLAHVKRGKAPIIEFEPYIKVFEEGSELPSADWRLARDLVLLRMVEQLYKHGWFNKNPDALGEELIETEEETLPQEV